MKSNKMMAMFVAGAALAVGTFLINPSAEALNVTTKKPATASVSSTAHYTYILGLDGNIWWTLSSSAGTTPAKTGNANNPFDLSGVNFGANGFVATTSSFCSGGVVVNSSATRGTCSQNWVKFPGTANFNDSPTVSTFGPIAASALAPAAIGGVGYFAGLPASTTLSFNIVAPGLDNNLWYTLFDASGNVGSTTALVGSSKVGVPASDPFTAAGEDADSGFSNTTNVTSGCAAVAPTRNCSGIFVAFP